MLTRLTRGKRLRAGWIVALAYLLCVLTPSASSALGMSQVPNCVVDGIVAQVTAHDHASMNYAAMNHAAMNHDHAGMIHQASDPTAPAGDHHKKTGGACCAVMCVSALPASLIDLGKPAPPVSTFISEATQAVTSSAPPLLYRPPIS